MTSNSSSTKPTILLVEDNQNIYQPLKMIMEKVGGYIVLVAVNGRHALEIYEQHASEIDLIVTDMSMPEMNGDILIQTLYEHNQDIRVICLSGKAGAQTGFSLPPVILEWIVKPIDGILLVEIINTYLHNAKPSH